MGEIRGPAEDPHHSSSGEAGARPTGDPRGEGARRNDHEQSQEEEKVSDEDVVFRTYQSGTGQQPRPTPGPGHSGVPQRLGRRVPEPERYRAGDGSDLRRGAPADEGWEEHYRGWLPSTKFLLLGEVATAALVTELAWILWLLAIALARGGLELPVPETVARHPVLAGVLVGLLIGLYVLGRLRVQRLARRKHLGGEG